MAPIRSLCPAYFLVYLVIVNVNSILQALHIWTQDTHFRSTESEMLERIRIFLFFFTDVGLVGKSSGANVMIALRVVR